MDRLKTQHVRVIAIGVNLLAIFAITDAQQSLVSTPAPQATTSTIIGSQSVDLISLRAYIGGTPLRHGNLIPGSERLQLNGVGLSSATDYAMDYAAGVVYLKVTQNVGDSLVAYYDYDPKPVKTVSSSSSAFQFNLLPGASLIMGMGMAERGPNGQVVNSNLFGTKNSLTFGGKSSLNGLMLMANQQGSDVSNQYTEGGGSAPAGGYNSSAGQQSTHFVVENYKSAVMGGSMAVDFQNISQKFANFSAVSGAGYSDADVARLQAEKGLDRTGVAFNGLKFGGLSLNNSMKSVQDSASGAGITWRNIAATEGGLKLSYSSQKVDDGFGRFRDLSEADKAQLLKERGMSRQNLAGQFQNKSGNLNFQTLAISDDIVHQGIHRNDLNFDSTRFKADYGTENVDTNFLRSSSLTAPEVAQYAREVGTSRQWFAFSGAPDAKSKPLTFGEMQLSSAVGKFNEKDVAFTGKSWNIQHIDLGGSPGFASMSALQDSVTASYAQKIGITTGALVPDAKGVLPAASAGDVAAFIASPTLKRDYTSGGFDFSKIWHFKFDDLGLKGVKDGGYASDASLTNGKLAASFHRQVFGENFVEAAGLMPIEQARLGVLPGLRREDFSFSDQISKVSKFSFTQLNSSSPTGGADRTVVSYATKGFSLDASQRKVDTSFTEAGQLVDPEAAILASLAGFRQRDLKFTWNKLPNIGLTGEAQDAKDEATGELRSLSNYKFNWNFNKTTQFSVTDSFSGDRTPTSNVLTTETRQISFSKDFGKYGKFAFLDELDLDEGTTATLPSDHKDYLSYETKLTSKTSFKLEQTATTFSDGTNQGISAGTLSTQLTKQIGVSLTGAAITGDSKQPNPGKTNYGVWYDLGNGVRISYGYAHQYNDASGTSASSGLAIGKDASVPTGVITPPGAPTAPAAGAPPNAAMIGPLSFAGGVGTNQYYNQTAGTANHTQAFNNMAVSTVKPFSLGPFSSMKFSIGMDTATDYNTWSKNNQAADLSGKFGSNSFALDYKGQLAPQGTEGVDRGFSLQTSKSAKAWLQASVSYKLRTLPGDVNYLIRDYNFSAKPIKNFEVTNQLQTNPEVVNAGVFLGSVPQAARSDKWNIAYTQGKDTTFGVTYQELVNQASNLRTTTSGLTLKLFQKSGSPISMFYGSEDIIGDITVPHRITNRYSMEFDQHPGPHQTFSMFIGNLSYDFNSPVDVGRQNWTVRCDYQLRF